MVLRCARFARESSAIMWASCLANIILGVIWYKKNMIYLWSKYNKELAIISTKAMNNPGYMIFCRISTLQNMGVSKGLKSGSLVMRQK